jgi:hypothetical protein
MPAAGAGCDMPIGNPGGIARAGQCNPMQRRGGSNEMLRGAGATKLTQSRKGAEKRRDEGSPMSLRPCVFA